MKKNNLFGFLTVFLFLIILLITDFILSNTIIKINHCYKYSEFFYELKKNCKGKNRFKKSFPLVNVYTDEMGLRVGKIKVNKSPDKKNIFIFGDSFTYGVGLEYEETYVGIIEKKLNNYNYYNFGVGSYSPSVYIHKLNEVLKSGLKSDKVIIFLDLSDVINESIRWKYNESNMTAKLPNKDLYNLVNSNKGDFVESNFKILKNISSLLNYNLRNLRAKIKKKSFNEYKVKTSIQGSFTYTELKNLDTRFWKNDTFLVGIKNIEKRFQVLEQLSNNYNFDIFLVIYPWAETLEFGQDKFNWSNFSKKLCSFERCHLIDSIPTFFRYKSNNESWITDLYFLNDEHLNKKGAKLLSEIVIKKLNEN